MSFTYFAKLSGNEAKEPHYKPKGDLVWYWNLEMEGIRLGSIRSMLGGKESSFPNRIPFVRFETEGSTLSSKYQIGNLDNLRSGNALLRILITNNDGAIDENDTYRRMVKIVGYYQHLFGDNNIIFADWTHVQKSMEGYKKDKSKYTMDPQYAPFVSNKGRGTEDKLHKDVKKHIVETLKESGLEIVESYESPYAHDRHLMIRHVFDNAKLSSEALAFLKLGYYYYPDSPSIETKHHEKYTYYIPQVDIAAIKEMPAKAVKWLAKLGEALRSESVNSCLLYCLANRMIDPPQIPILAIEVEVGNSEAKKREGSKHLLGGCTNASGTGYIGIMASYSNNRKHCDYMIKELGHKNLSFFDIDPIVFKSKV